MTAIVNKNNIYFNELRFSKIKSAMDTQKLMYLEKAILLSELLKNIMILVSV